MRDPRVLMRTLGMRTPGPFPGKLKTPLKAGVWKRFAKRNFQISGGKGLLLVCPKTYLLT